MAQSDRPNHPINREHILSGGLEAMVAEMFGDARHRLLPVEKRTAIKNAMLERVAAGDDVWVFGYGSLMWNPAFHYAERRVGRIHGYHRSFVFWTTSGRGSLENPGLMLALVRGGSCSGVAFRIEASEIDTEIECVFVRELMTGSYRPRWVNVKTPDGAVPAITFVANPGHDNYAGRFPLEEASRYIAHAEGHLGRCRDYLANTVRHLDEIGIHDRRMRALLRLVEARRAG